MTPWTTALANKLRGMDSLVTLALVGVILVTAYVLVVGRPRHKAVWLAYVLLP